MVKMARKATARNAKKAPSPIVKPIKQILTKSALITPDRGGERNPPEDRGRGLFDAGEPVPCSIHPRGVGEFVLPGLLKVGLRKVPARRAGTLVRNPATGEMVKAAAKPASVRVKIRALSKLKTAAGS